MKMKEPIKDEYEVSAMECTSDLLQKSNGERVLRIFKRPKPCKQARCTVLKNLVGQQELMGSTRI